MIRPWPFRKHDEPPGFWRGQPRLYSRWKFRGRTLVLVTVSTTLSLTGTDGHVTLEYQDEAHVRQLQVSDE